MDWWDFIWFHNFLLHLLVCGGWAWFMLFHFHCVPCPPKSLNPILPSTRNSYTDLFKKGKIHPIIQSLSAFALAAVTSRCQRRTVWVKVNVAEPTLEGLMDIVPWAPQWKDTVVASVQCHHRWLGRAGFGCPFCFRSFSVIRTMYILYRHIILLYIYI